MDSNEQTLTYAILIACLIGISLCVVLIIYVTGTDYFYHGYSELYLEDHTRLPETFKPGNPLIFSFTVVSHHNKGMIYEYRVYGDNETMQSGSFQIPDAGPDMSKTIPVSFIPNASGISDTVPSPFGGTGTEHTSSIGLAHIISVEVHEMSPAGDTSQQSYKIFFPVREYPE